MPDLYSGTVSDLPVSLPPDLAVRLTGALDRESKIARGLDALGPIAGRDVLLVDAEQSSIGAGLVSLGARLVHVRSEERRVGKECSLLCRSRWSPYH